MNRTFELTKKSKHYYQVSVSTITDHNLHLEDLIKFEELIDQINKIKDIKVLEFVGSDKYFSAGANVENLLNTEPTEWIKRVSQVPHHMLQIKPVTIGNMYGHAVGGGFAFGLWTDFPCLSEESLYGSNFVQIGITPGMGSTVVLESIMGTPLSNEMLFTGRLIRGVDIKNNMNSLSCRVYPRSEHAQNVAALIELLIGQDQAMLLMTKRQISTERNLGLAKSVGEEVKMHLECFNLYSE